jgi:hypothetical protein
MKKEIKILILNDEYSVIVCWGTDKDIKKVIARWHEGNADLMSSLSERRGVTFYKHGCHPIIALPQFPKTPEQIGTLSHEAVHAVSNIFRMIEQDSAEEVFAHSVGAIVRNVLQTK